MAFKNWQVYASTYMPGAVRVRLVLEGAVATPGAGVKEGKVYYSDKYDLGCS